MLIRIEITNNNLMFITIEITHTNNTMLITIEITHTIIQCLLQ